MKNELLKKFQTSSQTNGKLEYLCTNSRSLEKSQYNSLNKYNRSPYLQKVTNQLMSRKKNPIVTEDYTLNDDSYLNEHKKKSQNDTNSLQLRSFSNSSNYQLPKVNATLSPTKKPTIFKLPRIDQEQYSTNLEKQTVQSATLQLSSTKKKKLEPLRYQSFKSVIKTKAGTNGKQTKINQDCGFVEQKLPYGLKCYCICDGHGLNGHTVSQYIKTHMIKNLQTMLKKQLHQPQYEKMQQIIYHVFIKTNQQLLESDINTELSGSTVVAVFEYKSKLMCFNVGDSRAILCSQVENNDINHKMTHETAGTNKKQVELVSNLKDSKINSSTLPNQSPSKELNKQSSQIMKISLSKSYRLEKYSWKIFELSNDQKPDRIDQRQRVIKNGGRIECNKTQKGEEIGPLRVWMKDIQMPGLAMTRSFGDKAGLRAGTSGQPEVISHDISDQDKFIIIASDGVWQYMQNQQVMNAVIPFYLRNDIDMGAQRLVKLCTQIWSRVSYSRDDITLIIVSLNPAHN